MNIQEELNSFFVDCFYTILASEERNLEAITNGALSIKEIHLIEAVSKLQVTNDNNFSNVAKALGITLGTLTTAFNKLAHKGYLYKQRDEKDKRIYYMYPTKLGAMINDEHSKFHKAMTDIVTTKLPHEEQVHLMNALKKLSIFFKDLTLY